MPCVFMQALIQWILRPPVYVRRPHWMDTVFTMVWAWWNKFSPILENAAMIHAQRYRLMKGMSQYEDTESFY